VGTLPHPRSRVGARPWTRAAMQASAEHLPSASLDTAGSRVSLFAVRPTNPGHQISHYLWTLLLMAASTPFVLLVRDHVGPGNAELVYLVPVMIAAVHWGMGPAIAGVAAGMVTSAYLVHSPYYSLAIADREAASSLVLLTVVAVVTGKLADASRAHATVAEAARRRVETLYAFSRRLAAASNRSDIREAVQSHISEMLGTEAVLLTEPGPGVDEPDEDAVPDPRFEVLQEAARALPRAPPTGEEETTIGPIADGRRWLLRRVALGLEQPSVLAIALPPEGTIDAAGVRSRIDAVLAEAFQTLERLEISRALEKRRLEAQSELLRDALIGSVSHGLKTPLAAIVGSASVLAEAPPVANEPQLAGLTAIIAGEAERLDKDIQRLLDAARIGGAAVAPSLGWVDASDLVNTALSQSKGVLAAHRIEVDTGADLPFVRADAGLVVQALVQLLDNAAKYSPADSPITVVVDSDGDGKTVTIDVLDAGIGLDQTERAHLSERFFRGKRASETTRGTGLGLWIARSFVTACGGRLQLDEGADGHGTRARILLDAASRERMAAMESSDD
jgi:two-component system sensor histidine kinase KdpD